MKPKCKLVGQDGNVFNVIGLVAKSLRKAGQTQQEKEFTRKAFTCKSYDEVLRLAFEYVDVY